MLVLEKCGKMTWGENMKVVYPGSFDPVSNGHLDIIRRIAKLTDQVYVLVSVNPVKRNILLRSQNVELLKIATKDIPNVTVEASDKLVLEYAHKVDAQAIVRRLTEYCRLSNRNYAISI